MSRSDDDRESRNRQARLRDELDRQVPEVSDCHDDGVGRVVTAAGLNRFYLLQPLRISGPEHDGATPTFADDPDAAEVTALCLGPNLPGVGDRVCYSVEPGGRRVFNH